jgi:hypothetical protein
MALVHERTTPTERPQLVGEVTANLSVVRAMDPYDRNLGFPDRSRYFSIK